MNVKLIKNYNLMKCGKKHLWHVKGILPDKLQIDLNIYVEKSYGWFSGVGYSEKETGFYIYKTWVRTLSKSDKESYAGYEQESKVKIPIYKFK